MNTEETSLCLEFFQAMFIEDVQRNVVLFHIRWEVFQVVLAVKQIIVMDLHD